MHIESAQWCRHIIPYSFSFSCENKRFPLSTDRPNENKQKKKDFYFGKVRYGAKKKEGKSRCHLQNVERKNKIDNSKPEHRRH